MVAVGGLVAVCGWLRLGDDASRVAKIGSSCAQFKVNTRCGVGGVVDLVPIPYLRGRSSTTAAGAFVMALCFDDGVTCRWAVAAL